ncbi:hypothetical protein VHUM_01433 [Vanrija humicola]|uniref:Tetrahydrofolate dehydrogenase/cyclohydrolase catalytic domain-containing protein n=1 Tax=Vanrija humicola TaxID=5417 RepID=A0A7D8Z537_VANHU|nr:hypothetical protein VHUM_01433 [Vanrija humicola]
MYADMTARACKQAEVVFDKVDLSSPEDEAKILEINDDMAVDGLIVYFPLFDALRDAELRALIAPRVDVEGRSSPPTLPRPPCTRALRWPSCVRSSRARWESTTRTRRSVTASAARRSRSLTDTTPRSETVGRPLAGMLANDGARVYSVDIDSTHVYERDGDADRHTVSVHSEVKPALASLLAESDIVVTAVPGASFKVPTAALRPGAICIDLSELGNFEADVRDRAGIFAPRLGSVTILMLKVNAFVLRMQHQ